ncbi:major facilitator superfamily domain-containing protein [Microdochium trichocladiopsis]|uniref:Major facilitator superfamily domain-containing protein n=1 Tax=Microdochium trichocladiopsis TaxID=1682393 RepID=A0A9P9BKL4_9PEZI|nr:major facilitator superfamily domain-containing protein [Microdochium trichocladiopsis]KAH7027172.1 major facilitator superfamily domain-containing protein [Microdochium trichocladiopsis]
MAAIDNAEAKAAVKTVTPDHVEDHEGGVLLYDEEGHARRLPVPSSSPNDPLNFGPWRQRLILVAVCVYGITSFGVIQVTPLFFSKLIPLYKAQSRGQFPASQIIELASYPSLCMGLGNFLFVPLSMALGRRFSFILCNVLLLAGIIWAALSDSFMSHLGARCLQGLTAGVADCLLPIIVLDMTFLDRRSSRLVAYWTLTAVGSSLFIVPVPFITEAAGGNWRVGYWYWAAFAAFSLLAVVFLVPETLFHRKAAQFDGKTHVTDSYGTHRTFLTPEAAREAGFEVADDSQSETEAPAGEKSYLRQLAPFTVQRSPVASFFGAFRDIFTCLLIPGTFWALLFNSMVFGGLVALSLTYTERLELDPWHFSPSTVGTVQVGAAIGSLVGLAFGELAEPTSRWLTRRNHGVREPEHVLPNFIIPTISAFAGFIVYGTVGAEPQKYSWVGIHAAFALFYFGFCAISAVTGVWLGELLPHMSGPAIVLTCGGRNAVSFGYSSQFIGWIASIGFRQTYTLYGGVLFALGFLAIPLYFINPRIRRAMRDIKWLNAY